MIVFNIIGDTSGGIRVNLIVLIFATVINAGIMVIMNRFIRKF